MAQSRTQRFFRHGTLPQLRVFEAVARLGSFTRAGEETHIAQPTVSVHMKKLAETVGVPLVDQVGKRVRLTPAGEEVYTAARRVMQTFRELDETLADIAGMKAGRLRIATTTAGEYLLPPLLARFVERHPGIEVSLHVSRRDSVLERLARDDDDLYLLTNPPAGSELAADAILPNPLVAIAPVDHPLAREKNVSFRRFAEEPLLVREPGSSTRLSTEEVFASQGVAPKIRMVLGSSESIGGAMLAGLGVSLLHRYSLGFDIAARRLTVLDVQGLPHDGHWHVVRSPGKQLPRVAQAFVDFVVAEARQIFCDREAAHGVRLASSPRPARKQRRRSTDHPARADL